MIFHCVEIEQVHFVYQEKRESWIKTLAKKTPQGVMAVQTEAYSIFHYQDDAVEEVYDNVLSEMDMTGRELPPTPIETESTVLYETIDEILPSKVHSASATVTRHEPLSAEISPYGVYYTSQELKKESEENVHPLYDNVLIYEPEIPEVPPPPSPDVIKELMPSVIETDDTQTPEVTSQEKSSHTKVYEQSVSKLPSEDYEDMISNEGVLGSDTYEYPEILDEKKSEETDHDSNVNYTYVDAKPRAIPFSPVDVQSSSFGHLTRSVSAGQLVIPPHPQHQSSVVDQNYLQLTILVQDMHQMLAQMQATYAQSFSLQPQEMVSKKFIQPPENDGIGQLSSSSVNHGDIAKDEQLDQNSANAEAAATKINMKKCLG